MKKHRRLLLLAILTIFSQFLIAQNASYNPSTGKIEMTVEMARELATIVIERDTLLNRNTQLSNELNDAIGDIDLLLHDYNQTVKKLTELRLQNESLTSQIDDLNQKEINYWKKKSKGLKLDIYLNTTINDWQSIVAIPTLSLPFAGKWSLNTQAIVTLNQPVNYLVGIGYRVF